MNTFISLVRPPKAESHERVVKNDERERKTKLRRKFRSACTRTKSLTETQSSGAAFFSSSLEYQDEKRIDPVRRVLLQVKSTHTHTVVQCDA